MLINKYIVAIDDTESIRMLLRISLEAEGARFDGAATASGGLALCESKNPDLVILDLGLPDREGFTILPRLKRRYNDKELPVLVLTVRNEPEFREQAEKLGANAYVTKPFSIDNLINLIHDTLHVERNCGE